MRRALALLLLLPWLVANGPSTGPSTGAGGMGLQHTYICLLSLNAFTAAITGAPCTIRPNSNSDQETDIGFWQFIPTGETLTIHKLMVEAIDLLNGADENCSMSIVSTAVGTTDASAASVLSGTVVNLGPTSTNADCIGGAITNFTSNAQGNCELVAGMSLTGPILWAVDIRDHGGGTCTDFRAGRMWLWTTQN